MKKDHKRRTGPVPASGAGQAHGQTVAALASCARPARHALLTLRIVQSAMRTTP
jgi:hypothetical protein